MLRPDGPIRVSLRIDLMENPRVRAKIEKFRRAERLLNELINIAFATIGKIVRPAGS